MHPLGFTWKVSSRDSLRTFLSSCEPYTSKIVSRLAPRINTFICVGANRGWYPMLVRSRNTSCKIYAFECNSAIHHELYENIEANKANVELVKKAVGASCGSSLLYLPSGGNEGMSTLFPQLSTKSPASEVEKVEVINLDSYFQNQNSKLGQVVMLIDIEGGELNALRGSVKLLSTYSPLLILEINEKMLEAAGSSAYDLLTFLADMGYFVYWIDEREKLHLVDHLNKLPHTNVLPIDTGSNYLCTKNTEFIENFRF
jgi:FkbM family methyltransferase